MSESVFEQVLQMLQMLLVHMRGGGAVQPGQASTLAGQLLKRHLNDVTEVSNLYRVHQVTNAQQVCCPCDNSFRCIPAAPDVMGKARRG